MNFFSNIDAAKAALVAPNYLEKSAWVEHIPFAFWLTTVLRPERVVELGTHLGTSYFAFCQGMEIAKAKGAMFAVDTWVGDAHSGPYGEEVYDQVSRHNEKHYSQTSKLLRLTFDQAVSLFDDASIDLLHIDGYHTYEAVSHDFEMWRNKLSKRAVVLLHDTNVKQSDFGVYRYFSEIKSDYPHFEFLHGYGLGVLGTGDSQVSDLKELYQASGTDKGDTLRQLFSRLGKACLAESKAWKS